MMKTSYEIWSQTDIKIENISAPLIMPILEKELWLQLPNNWTEARAMFAILTGYLYDDDPDYGGFYEYCCPKHDNVNEKAEIAWEYFKKFLCQHLGDEKRK